MTTDMTEGKIVPQLTGFAIPLVLGNLFQLTYNAADSVIVGKFVGEEALAAVGTAGPIMNMIILFISGMCMGADGHIFWPRTGCSSGSLRPCTSR